MKITRIHTDILRIPEDDPLADMPEEAGRLRPIVILRMQTDSGIEGIGLTFYGGAMTGTLRTAVDELGALTVGEDPLRIEAIVRKLRAGRGRFLRPRRHLHAGAVGDRHRAVGHQGQGARTAAVEAARRHARPGATTYASGSLRRGLTDAQAATAARRLVDKGFVEMKTQMALPGNPSPAEEVRRVRVVRDAIGPDIKLMCDINQRWRVEQAIDIGHRVEDVGLFWLEDVTTCDDYAGLARVNAALSTPIAGGEYVWGITPFRQMIEARSVDYIMIDLCRVGGADAMDEGRRHGRGVQPAGGQPRDAGDAPAPGRRDPERADGGIHAVDAEAVPGDAGDREGAAGAAEQAGAGAGVRREGGGGVPGGVRAPLVRLAGSGAFC